MQLGGVDVAQPADEHILTELRTLDVARTVVAANKCDLVSDQETRAAIARLQQWSVGPVCQVSALAGTGVEALRDTFTHALSMSETTTPAEALVLTRRQRTAVANAHEAIQRAGVLSEGATETIDCADVLAFELREALDILGAVVGDVTTEDLLHQVFANFCIGK